METKPNSLPSVGVLGASFETDNMGLGALTAGTIQCIRHQIPGVHVFLMDYSRKPTVRTVRIDGEDLAVPLLNIRYSKKLFLSNNIPILILFALLLRLIPVQSWRRRVACMNRCMRAITDADLFVSVAGGDSFSDIYGFGRLLYVTLPQWLVLLAGKRLILMPQTLGPFKSYMAKVIARSIVSRAEIVYSRDRSGIEETRTLLGHSSPSANIRFCCDVGMLLEPVRPAKLRIDGMGLESPAKGLIVGFNVSGLLYMEGYTRDNMFGLNVNYRVLVRNIIEHLINQKEARVLLIPHVFGTDPGTETDSLACEKVYDDLKDKYEGRLGVVRGHYNQNEIKYIIGRCDLVIGSRMHACIAAISQCVPAISIAYSDKFKGVMQSAGVQSSVVDPRKLSMDEILIAISNGLDGRESTRRQLQEVIPVVKNSILNTFSDEIRTKQESSTKSVPLTVS
jgi:colanic acid/amylovoran biosynthesis protein